MAPSAQGVRAGRAFVELYGVPEKLYRVLDAAKLRVITFAKGVAKIGVGAAGLGGAVLTPIAKFFTDAVNQGADIEQLAQRFHTTAESISTLRGAFAQAGVPAEEFGGIMDGLATKIAGAADSRDELIHGLQGLRGDFLLGKGVDEQLDLIAEKFKTIKAAEDQIRVANELGLGGMLPYLKLGRAGLDEMRRAAVANGDAMSGSDAKAGLQIQKEYSRTVLAVKSTLIAVGKALLPVGMGFAEFGANVRSGLESVREWIGANKRVIVVVTGIAAGLVAGGAALVTFSAGLAVVAPLLTAGVLVVKGLVAAFLALTSPIGLTVAGLAALGAIWATQTESGMAFVKNLTEGFTGLLATVKQVGLGLMDALKAGDWELAGKIALTGLEIIWEETLEKMSAVWREFQGTILGQFIADIKRLVDLIKEALELIPKLPGAPPQFGKGQQQVPPGGKGIRGRYEDFKKGQKPEDETPRHAPDKFRPEAPPPEKEKPNRIKELQDELQKLLEEAKAKAKAAAQGEAVAGGFFNRIAGMTRNVGKLALEVPSFTQLYASQKGIFGGNAQQQLGYGDQIGQRQLDATNEIKVAAKQQVALLDQLPEKLAGVWT